jgi:hypothetical protein
MVSVNDLPAFLPRADLEAIRWAQQHLPHDGLIFCSTVSGRLIPALAGRPVYVGHWSETPHANERMLETIQFYRATNATSAERRAFLRARGVRYVYQGTPERQIGAADLSADPLFHPIFQNDGAAIYELRDTVVAGRTARPATRSGPAHPRLASPRTLSGSSLGSGPQYRIGWRRDKPIQRSAGL